MAAIRGSARTAETYVAGFGASGALMVGALVLFLLVVGIITAWPQAGGLFNGPSAEVGATSRLPGGNLFDPKARAGAAGRRGAAGHGAGRHNGAGSRGNGGTGTGGSQSGGGGSQGNASPSDPTSGARNTVGSAVGGATNGVGNAINGATNSHLGDPVSGVGNTVNGRLGGH